MYMLLSAQARCGYDHTRPLQCERKQKNERQLPNQGNDFLQNHQAQPIDYDDDQWKLAPPTPHLQTPSIPKHQYMTLSRSLSWDSFSTITTAAETPDYSMVFTTAGILMDASLSREDGVPLEVCILTETLPNKGQNKNNHPVSSFTSDQYDGQTCYGASAKSNVSSTHSKVVDFADFADGCLGTRKENTKLCHPSKPLRQPSEGLEYIRPPLRKAHSKFSLTFGEI